jgi:two-component system CheB/CheR fusion protein
MATRKQPRKNAAYKTHPKNKKARGPSKSPQRAQGRPPAPDNSLQVEAEGGTFPIVGIGASAGGLEAFTELLQNLPSDTGMGFVFVPHLDPKHVSLLTELLQRHTSMAVEEAINGVKVAPNRIYLIPRNMHMTLVNGALLLSPRQSSPIGHMPIDPFLRSLAADQKSKAIGVILSGNASDGTLGMMAIKAAGGITFAQSSDTAKYDSMPRSAIAAGCIDFVLPPKDIAHELAHLREHPYISPAKAQVESDVSPSTTEAIGRVMSLLRNVTGVDFAYYKPSTLRRRILRRMALQRIENLDRYIAKLRGDSRELRALYEDILINVTEFFRDPDAFEALARMVFPKIVPVRNSGPIRIWVPGCSSGEEVYSIAITLLEFLGERSSEVSIQIFGTDISDVALDKARSGIYAPGLVESMSPERIRKFFRRIDSSYGINKRIREMCIFAKQNLVKDPPFSKVDLISCRNLLIYLGPVLQKRLVPVFHYALKPTGFLLLGSSETIGATELFSLVDKKNKIYSRLPTSDRVAPEFSPEEVTTPTQELRPSKAEWTDAELAREADRIVLGKYSHAGAVVDNEFTIIQFRGKTSPYLEHSSGGASLSIFSMARQGLAGELRSVLHRARQGNVTVRVEGVRIRRDAVTSSINIEVVPLKKSAGRGNRYLVLFDEAHLAARKSDQKPAKKRGGQHALERELNQVRQELIANKEYLQSIIEQHDTSNEELRSANEEIQSSNEELQSTNEELETAKEELQSTNEELNTVNEELLVRNAQLAQSSNDLLNLLSNVNIPIIMVGNDLRIRRFTPISQRLLNFIPSDVGRPISDIKMNLDIPKLESLLLQVIESLTPQSLNVKDSSGRLYSVRIRPYRTEDNKIDGAVIVMVDVDTARDLATSIQFGDGSDNVGALGADELRGFTAGLIVAQERERQSIALELHDDITQRMALLELGLESMARMRSADSALNDHIKKLQEELMTLGERMRHVSHQLHPSMIEDLGLVPALEQLIREVNTNPELKVTFQYDDIPGKLHPDVALCLYRVAQEAMHNIVKHSGAKAAQVTLKGIDPNMIQLKLIDSGNGFAPDGAIKKGLGLRSMEARVRYVGGTFKVESRPGKGTEATATVPVRGA